MHHAESKKDDAQLSTGLLQAISPPAIGKAAGARAQTMMRLRGASMQEGAEQRFLSAPPLGAEMPAASQCRLPAAQEKTAAYLP